MSDRLTTAALQTALLKSYPLPEYATFFEVGDATGGRHSRWADAVSMACWPSRGLRIWGFELKASRGDWLREKKKPEKSCAVQRFCDHWVIVTPPDVVQPGELPQTWGHLVLKGGRLSWQVPAPQLTPDPLEASFVAALLRRCGQVSAERMAVAIDAATADARAAVDERIKREVECRFAFRDKAVTAVEAFKLATGIDLASYGAHDAGKHFAAYREARRDVESAMKYSSTAASLRKAADAVDAARAAVESANLIEKSE